MEVLNKSGRFKRGTYKPLHANNKLTLTKVLIKKINNESNFRKWVGKMAEREGLPLYIANVNNTFIHTLLLSIHTFFNTFHSMNLTLHQNVSRCTSKIINSTQTSSQCAKNTNTTKSTWNLYFQKRRPSKTRQTVERLLLLLQRLQRRSFPSLMLSRARLSFPQKVCSPNTSKQITIPSPTAYRLTI